MHSGRIAVVGDRDIVLAFSAVGMQHFACASPEECEQTIRKIAKEYAVILITENYAEAIAGFLNRYKDRPYPAIIPIPGAGGSTGFGLSGLTSDIEKAVGTDIQFQEE